MKLLLLSLDAYSIFYPDSGFIFGGAEVETGYHSRGLAALGVETIVVTRDHAFPASVTSDGVSIVPHPEYKGTGYWNWRKTLKGRLVYRLLGDRNPYRDAEQLFAAINPDVAYVMGIVPEAKKLAAYCRAAKKKFIFRVAHDMDLGGGELTDERMQKWAGMTVAEARAIIDTAAVVLVQTPLQQELLRREFGREGVMMFPPIELGAAPEQEEKIYDVLWIGKNNSFKRPEELVRLASALPARKFCMLLNIMEPEGWKAIVATLPPNVTLVESVPVDRVEKLFRQSRVFVSTSLHEGFANTFLQAGKNNVPVVSMGSDPNGMLSVYGAGALPGDDQQRLVQAVEQLLTDPVVYKNASVAARKFVERFHDKTVIARQFYELL